MVHCTESNTQLQGKTGPSLSGVVATPHILYIQSCSLLLSAVDLRVIIAKALIWPDAHVYTYVHRTHSHNYCIYLPSALRWHSQTAAHDHKRHSVCSNDSSGKLGDRLLCRVPSVQCHLHETKVRWREG